MLDLKDVSISFGGLRAVNAFSFSVGDRELCGLIGPNGAGKTTVFNLMTGVYRPDSGLIHLAGKKVSGLPPHEIARSGISRTFQNIRLFRELSVVENVLVSFHMRSPYKVWDAILNRRKFRDTESTWREKARELLSIFSLDKRQEDRAGSLSYGAQRRLEIVRALAAEPRVILLDEPAAGLNSQEKVTLMNTISLIRDRFKVAILLIEHDMRLVMGICEKIAVLDHGEKISEGTPKEIQADRKVIEAYLGVA